MLTLICWAISGSHSLLLFVLLYLIFTLVLGFLLQRTQKFDPAFLPLSSLWIGSILSLLITAISLRNHPPDWLSPSALKGIWVQRKNKAVFENTPSLFPRIIRSDHPQRFYISAPGTKNVALNILDQELLLPAVDLGNGLFSLDFNPWEHRGALPSIAPGEMDIRIDTDNGSHIRKVRWIQPLAHPRWLDSRPELGIAITVSEETDESFWINREGTLSRFDTLDGPADVQLFTNNNELFAAIVHRYSQEVLVFSLATLEVRHQIPVHAGQVRCALSPEGTRLAVSTLDPERELQIMDPLKGTLLSYLDLPFTPDWICFGENDQSLVFTCRQDRSLYMARQVDGDWQLRPGRIYLGRPATTLCRSRDGKSVYISNTGLPIDGADRGGNHFVQHHIARISIETEEILANWVTDRRTQMQSATGSLDSGISPMGLSLAESSGLLITFAGSDECWIASENLDGNYRRINLEGKPLSAPHGIADLGSGILAVTSPSQGMLALVRPGSSENDMLYRPVSIQNKELMSEAPSSYKIRLGEQSFYETTQAGVSCQSCHLHGDSDYSKHNLGPGLFHATLSSRGVAFTEPFLRDGSFPTMEALHAINEGIYRGYRKPFPEDRGSVLKAYVESLSFEPNPAWTKPRDLERERSGVRAFDKANCSQCHSFPAFTHLGKHPIHLLFPQFKKEVRKLYLYDTPSLRSLWNSAPYLYNGRAETLKEVLTTHNPDKQHGDVSLLTETELEDLLHFLNTL